MKKAIVLTLLLALLLSLGVPAYAFTAKISNQAISVNGELVDCERYNIDGSNYFKLRDLAQLLNGTKSQFDVGYDNAKKLVTITTNHAYTTPNGQELVVGEDKSATAKVSTQTIVINGVERSDLTVYNIGGSNFFQLRDMGDALGFDVDYDTATRTMLVTSRDNQPEPEPEPEPEQEETPQDDAETIALKRALEDMKRYPEYLYNEKEILKTDIDLYNLGSTIERGKRILTMQDRVHSMWDEVESMKKIYDDYMRVHGDSPKALYFFPMQLDFEKLTMPVYSGLDRSYISDVRTFISRIEGLIISYKSMYNHHIDPDYTIP